MNKTEIKNSKSNELIMALVDTYTVIVINNGVRCAGKNKELNNIANELLNRSLLTETDIQHLNM